LLTQISFIILFKTAITATLLIAGTILVVSRETTLGQFVASERTIINNITANFNQIITSNVIVGQQTENVLNYQRLINAELINLQNGESDLFKLNIQLEKLFGSQLKLVKTISDLEKQKAELYWAAGVRPLVN
jgi:outer membrane protein TolC